MCTFARAYFNVRAGQFPTEIDADLNFDYIRSIIFANKNNCAHSSFERNESGCEHVSTLEVSANEEENN